MKRIQLLILLWIAAIPLFAQLAVNVSGTVTNTNSGTPVVNHEVYIQLDSLISPTPYTVVITNPNGYYTATIPLNPAVNVGTVIVSTYDCQNYYWSFSHTFTTGTAQIVQNFLICSNSSTCLAEYSYSSNSSLEVQFADYSIGGIGIWNWDFGDGTTSTQQNPLHTFPVAGYYSVSLTIGAQGTTCWDAEVKMIWVGDTIPGSCSAGFTYVTTSPSSSTCYFYDQSITSVPVSWFWDFGDGTYSTEQNPVHTFPPNVPPMPYNVCLTISSIDSSCYSTVCQPVYIGQTTTCQADFDSYPIPGTYNNIQFSDLSVGNIQTWTWNFGDGTTQTISFPQNPNVTHYYQSPGTYVACLNILGLDSCTSSFCDIVYVGDSISGCQAFYNAYLDSITTGLVHFEDVSQGNPTQWFWDFGDGTSSTLQNPTHQFQVNGPYTQYDVCLTITGANGCTDTYCMIITLNGNPDCQAYYIYVSTQWTPPYSVQFYDASTFSGTVSWFWDFGDGNYSTEQNPTHVFASNPTFTPYNVCLTITDSLNGCSSTYCSVITIGTNGCVAWFQSYPGPNPSPGTNLSVYFDDVSTGNIQTWSWNFGDGTGQIINYPDNPDVVHTYPAPGYYYVTLSIYGDSCSSVYSQTITVMDSLPSCQAQFSWYPANNTGNAIQFIDLSTGGYIMNWLWDFGDGATSIEPNPVHTFSTPGTYNVCLTVYGLNCQSSWCMDVEVGTNPNCINYFTYSNLGLSVNFEGHVLDSINSTTQYAWDFGDNQAGIGENVVHTYNTPGVYFVTLTTTTMSQGIACTATSSQLINVGDTVVWNQVYGQVFAGNFPLTQGMAMLFSVDTTNTFVPFVDVATIDSMGMFYFSMVPQGNFVLYAIPFEYGYLPTYFGDVLYWQDASVISLGTPANPYYIHLIDASTIGSGSGSIQGQLSGGDIANSLIDKVTMLLKDESGNVVFFSQVDAAGNFEFPQLAYGTYYLYAELTGCSSQTIKVVISESNPAAQVNLTLSGGSILGRNDGILSLEAGVVYPNPVKETATISVSLSHSADLRFEIFNMAGQKIIERTESLGIGQNKVSLGVSQLAGGVYTLKVYSRDGLLLTRKLVK